LLSRNKPNRSAGAGQAQNGTHVQMIVNDALAGKHGEYEMVLTNPPFGKKSSVTIVNEAGDEEKQSLVVHRDDFWASTSKCEPHRHYSSISSSTSSPS
jgi:hypothetical protein